MAHTLTDKDRARLVGLHPDLVRLVNEVARITTLPFTILEGVRSVAKQRENVKKGVSWTMNSRHLTGHAVDLAPIVNGKVSWDWPVYFKFAPIVKQAAKNLGLAIEWGWDWRKTKDGPHWQLPWASHAATTSTAGKKPTPLPKEVTSAPAYTEETQGYATGKAVATSATGVAVGTSIAAEPLATAVDGIQQNSWALSSGDYVQIAVAVVVIGLTVYAAWRGAVKKLTAAAEAAYRENKEREAELLLRASALRGMPGVGANARWVAIAATHFEQGFMALNRAIADGEPTR